MVSQHKDILGHSYVQICRHYWDPILCLGSSALAYTGQAVAILRHFPAARDKLRQLRPTLVGAVPLLGGSLLARWGGIPRAGKGEERQNWVGWVDQEVGRAAEATVKSVPRPCACKLYTGFSNLHQLWSWFFKKMLSSNLPGKAMLYFINSPWASFLLTNVTLVIFQSFSEEELFQ